VRIFVVCFVAFSLVGSAFLGLGLSPYLSLSPSHMRAFAQSLSFLEYTQLQKAFLPHPLNLSHSPACTQYALQTARL